MKGLKKIAIILILFLVGLTILREVGLVSINYYKSISHLENNYNWTDQSRAFTVDSASMGTKFHSSLFSNLPVVVLYKDDTLYQDSSDLTQVIITIDTLSPGFLWTPIYKSSKFMSTATSSFTKGLIKTPAGKIKTINADLKGQLRIRGNISITGLCSYREAKSIVKELIVKSLVEETKRYYSTLD